MQYELFSAFSKELEKIAVDTTTLAARTTGPGQVRNITGHLGGNAQAFSNLLRTGGAMTIPKSQHLSALKTAPVVGSGPITSKTVTPAVVAHSANYGGSTMVHPEIAARMSTALTGMPHLGPEGQTAHTGVTAAHEIAERRIRPRNVVGGFYSHLSPDVLLQEHNTLSRLTGPGAAEARNVIRSQRALSGEAPHLQNMVTTAFNDPRAASFLAEGEKVPKAMRKALLRKIQQDPSIISRSAPQVGILEKLKGLPSGIARQGRVLSESIGLGSRFGRGLL